MVLSLSCSLHAKSHVRKYSEPHESDEIMRGSIQTSIVAINFFSELLFRILMFMSYSFKRSIFQVNSGSQCQKTECQERKVFANTVHCHTVKDLVNQFSVIIFSHYATLDQIIWNRDINMKILTRGERSTKRPRVRKSSKNRWRPISPSSCMVRLWNLEYNLEK